MKFISILRILIAGLVIGLSFFGWQKYQTIQWRRVDVTEPNISLELPPTVLVKHLSSDDVAAKVAFRATNGDTERRPYILTVRTESGLRISATLSHQDIPAMTLANSVKAFPLRFPEFTQQSQRTLEVDGHKAGELVFTYKAPAGNKTQQRFVVIDKDGRTAIYLAFQAQASDFDELNKRVFERIVSSLKLR